jgi:hypothetical protein
MIGHKDCVAAVRQNYIGYDVLCIFITFVYRSISFFTILFGFMWNKSVFRIPIDILRFVWTSIIIAEDRLYTLSMALVPELLQNWLDTTLNGEVLLELVYFLGPSVFLLRNSHRRGPIRVYIHHKYILYLKKI